MATIDGNNNNNDLFGTANDDIINGFGGDDSLEGFGGDDILNGGDGMDLLIFSEGSDTANGDAGNDTFLWDSVDYDSGVGAGGTSSFGYGGTGNDRLDLYTEMLTTATLHFDGGAGIDRVSIETTSTAPFSLSNLSFANVEVFNAGGLDITTAAGVLSGFTNFEELTRITHDDNGGLTDLSAAVFDRVVSRYFTGGAGDDVIYTTEGFYGNWEVDGGAGDDTIYSGRANEVINGGAGDDLLVYGELQAWPVNGADTMDGGTGTDTIRIEVSSYWQGATLDMSSGFSSHSVWGDVSGGSYRLVTFSNIEHVHIYSNTAGNDIFVMANGDDIIQTGAGNDRLFGRNGADTLSGGDGEDFLRGDNGDDTLNGDAGNDKLFGGIGNDTLNGGDGDDRIKGADGQDIIDGGAGRDSISGGNGVDIIDGGAGNDTIQGGAGNDIINGGTGVDRIQGNGGNDTINGEADNDFLYGRDGDDILDGGAGNDRVQGDDGADWLRGGDGNDDIFGGAGNDLMEGGAGNDLLRGSTGNDRILSGAGTDDIGGGSGADTFVFEAGDSVMSARDRIQDFRTEDTIEIAGHTFIGEGGFTGGGAFEVRYSSNSNVTFFELDRDGDGNADERINLTSSVEWDFVSDGTNITGVVASPEDALI